MSDTYVEGNFLGLPESGEAIDVVVLPLPYELTTSYGQGTAEGPAACLAASGQVELFDAQLGQDLPAGASIHTASAWEGHGATLRQQLDELGSYLAPWCTGDVFPIALGGEHGILPPLMWALKDHPSIKGDLTKLTIVQIDAHADLRSELNGEVFSHACAAGRALDMGVGRLLQVGIRAYSQEEAEWINTDERITTFFARDTQSPITGKDSWQAWLTELASLTGPVHLTIDIDGLDSSLVPATGTPVPGGLSYWQAVETIEAVFNAQNATVISADVNEIATNEHSPVTEFTAAMLMTKTVASHLKARKDGRWKATSKAKGIERAEIECTYFTSLTKPTER
ncbi:MAG: arginase family protein [Candidatus Poseidoniaceae archaeon]|nr:arginase family protein [Candidatus Poseidoniaceae archaeon]